MTAKWTWGLLGFACAVALAFTVPLAFAAGALTTRGSFSTQGNPGNASAGKKVFIEFCGKCHTMAAAGSSGTLGPNLDQDNVSFSGVVSAVEEGVGGIQAEYILREVTFSQIYDVAKFVSSERKGATIGGSSGNP